MGIPKIDWNTNDDFFRFTRGRFVVEGEKNLRRRETSFDMNELASAAAVSVGATQCMSIKKYPDGMYNKAYLMSMDNGLEIVAKVPNPNAGTPHFTTASEVATMDFARNVLDTPAPRVYAWSSQAKSNPVGAEYIIMEKVEGVPLSQVWNSMQLPQKLKVLRAMTRLQKQWLNCSFSHYGGLYYARDVRQYAGSHYLQDGNVFRDTAFAIGPATGRDWFDAGRSRLNVERGPWTSLVQYLEAVGDRETEALRCLNPPKQIALFCGPKLYRPDKRKKLEALSQYRQIVEALLPGDTAITSPRLWHDDTHVDNIYIDPQNGTITGIIDWQSCHVSPLFNHNPDPAFLDWDGLEPEDLELVPRPNFDGMSPEKRTATVRENDLQNVFIGWRKLMQAKNADLYRVVEFRKTAAYGLIFLAHRLFEYGEAHFQSLLIDLKDSWASLPAVEKNDPYPFDFSEAEIEKIKMDSDNAVAGTELVAEVKETLGDLWPDKGLIEHDRYDECKAALEEIKEQILEQLSETDEGKAEYNRYWPFD